jgi:hypothetical protein
MGDLLLSMRRHMNSTPDKAWKKVLVSRVRVSITEGRLRLAQAGDVMSNALPPSSFPTSVHDTRRPTHLPEQQSHHHHARITTPSSLVDCHNASSRADGPLNPATLSSYLYHHPARLPERGRQPDGRTTRTKEAGAIEKAGEGRGPLA